jgi:bifunctional UDP-N-acetylglucosamine pyrophosphorylase / glucosamine-1-phosphate N-acetyltransferase
VERVIVIPAAGSGSRLGAAVPKLLVPVHGRPMIEHLLALYASVAERAVVVVSPAALPVVDERLANAALPVSLVVQHEPTGMLDAVLLARPAVEAALPRRVLITWCDQVAILPATVDRIVDAARSEPEPDLVLPTCLGEHPYVHLTRDHHGRIDGVLHRREGDAMPDRGESDAGVFDLSCDCYLQALPRYAVDPAIGARTGERNFVPFVARVAQSGVAVTVPCSEREEAIGINTPEELAVLEAHLRARNDE